ncbi:hypothetical protein [Chromobacterium vaccinii]|uniref:hypothetical protein n=1 Tax=Chromobacterium vaccinii TaxID=1108595 RepID=UPI000B28E1E7|nr:hypothetical protein [Chromobacterium vaccinii]QND82953.1 Uncharacterized protein ChrSW_0725 [Chromobacterium vaccinii]QND88184.1 Uncharacterized protein ChrSV_0725 [Chromobacterium vaccinii]
MCMKEVRRFIRLFSPDCLLPCLWESEELAQVQLERERYTVSKVAKEFITRTKASHYLLARESTKNEQNEDQERANTLLKNINYTWNELFELETLAIKLSPLHLLPAVAPELFPNYLSSSPSEEKKDDEIRNKALFSKSKGQHAFLKSIGHEKAVDRLRLRLLIFTSLVFLTGLLYQNHYHPLTDLLAYSMGFGLLGSFFSILHRIQTIGGKESDETISMLTSGSWSLYLSLASGIVSGTLIYFFFCGHIGDSIFSTNLIPSLDKSGLFHSDSCRMAIWGFISGFSERFIPDLLSKLENGSSQTKNPQPPTK